MTLIELLVILVVIGTVMYVFNQVLPMDARIKLVINAIVMVALCLWLLEQFGLFPNTALHMRIR